MPTLLIRGARQLLTLRGANEPRLGSRMMDLGAIPDGSILIQGGRICEIGSTRRVANLVTARGLEEIDASGCVVLPGFVDPLVDLIGLRPSLAGIARRASLLLQHGTTTAGAVSGHRKPLHLDDALLSVGLDVTWDAHWAGRVFLPMEQFLKKLPLEGMRQAVQAGMMVALSTGFREPDIPTCSMLATISVACLRGDLAIEEAIVAATTNAAHLLGIGDRCGSLDPGRMADIVILDVGDYSAIPFCLGANVVRTVIKRGLVAYQRQELAVHPEAD